MELWKLSWVANEILVAADAPTTQHITVEDVYRHIDRGDLFIWLTHDLEPKVSFDNPTFVEKDRAEILDYLDSMYNAYGGDHYRKWGIENRGLLLLVAWINEAAIQAGRRDRKDVPIR